MGKANHAHGRGRKEEEGGRRKRAEDGRGLRTEEGGGMTPTSGVPEGKRFFKEKDSEVFKEGLLTDEYSKSL